jgi:hypothetical protein
LAVSTICLESAKRPATACKKNYFDINGKLINITSAFAKGLFHEIKLLKRHDATVFSTIPMCLSMLKIRRLAPAS